ncbi:amidohydrolase family protein [Burkholderia sp. Ax-1719]|uniref:amidohydrolase family protein n=1 Tax=Burkholderia sp. Ax-1719 TaxID=2608334 RepID=UPI00141F4D0F|nr:amidohydrolase family protein [Burkholderia sp. Ax-1719]
MIVDSHCHVGINWYEPVETLLHHMDSNGVERAVLVQSLGQFDNTYQAECVARYPERLASIVHINIEDADAPTTLTREVGRGAVGIRLRPPVGSSCNQVQFWELAEELNITVSCVGTAEEFASAEFRALLERLPNLSVVIEHLGNLQSNCDMTITSSVLSLGKLPNAYMKFHGLSEYTRKALPKSEDGFPFETPVPPLMLNALDAFGAEKLMWGSDWPIVSMREGYRNALRWPRDILESRGESLVDSSFGGVAHRMYWR